MSSFHSPERTGAPSFTAASASLSLSGLDHFDGLVDPLLDSPEWFHGPSEPYLHNHHHQHHHHPPLSPTHEPFAPSYGAGIVSHTGPVGSDALQRPSYPALSLSMNGVSLQRDHPGAPPQSRFDDHGAISPLQTTYPPYGAPPYPDSTSSAHSEDPVAADADEDKRKRNQAASARFRQKKKQREQQMMEQSREMVDRTKKLEGEVETLKRENTFLKRLLVEKVDNMNDTDKALLVKTTQAERKK